MTNQTTKTLRTESPLNYLPNELSYKELMLLDSLRFTLEMIDYNFYQLVNNLEQLASGKANKIHFKIFNYSWTLIDHSYRFYRLFKKLNTSEQSIINRLKYLDRFRNTIQHLDERIEKTILKNNRPIFGSLKCVVNDVEKKEVYTSIFVSGIFRVENIEFRQHAQTGYNNFINDIILETDTKKKNDTNEINLSKLIEEISEISLALDNNLEEVIKTNNWKLIDWQSMKDIVLDMKNLDVNVKP